MKSLIALSVLAMAFGLLMATAVSAEENLISPAPDTTIAPSTTDDTSDLTETELEDIETSFPESTGDAGATPDSPIAYGLDRAIERISLALTFDKAAKAQKGLEHAKERLLEVKAMILAKKIEQAEKARELYEEKMNEVREAMENVAEDGNQNAILNNIRNTVRIENRIDNQEAVIEALKDILSEQNLTDEQRARLESVISRIENKTDDLKDKAEKKQDKVRDRLRAVTGKNEHEIDDIVSNMTSEEGTDAARQALAERWIARTEESLAKIKAKIESDKAKGFNQTEVEKYLAEVEAKLSEARAAYVLKQYEKALEILKPVNNYGRQLSNVVKMKAKVEKLKEVRQEELERIQERVAKLNEERARILSRVNERLSNIEGKSEKVKEKVQSALKGNNENE